MPYTRKYRAKPLRIDFRSNSWDKKVLKLSRLRFFASVIAQRTGLTIGQVTGRRYKAGIRVSDYMRGITPQARKALNKVDNLLGDVRKIQKLIKRHHANNKHKRH
jgi:hypothetical protein